MLFLVDENYLHEIFLVNVIKIMQVYLKTYNNLKGN